MLKKMCFPLCALAFACLSAAAQRNLVHVNQATGTATVSIPLFNVQSGSLSLPVGITYGSTGARVKDPKSRLGVVGWQLVAGGQITRQLRGLPDDCVKNERGQQRKGWLYNSGISAIAGFTVANNNGATCADTSDLAYIRANFAWFGDTEPDLFNVNAPGLSCQLVFDVSRHIQVIPYKDLKVSYTMGADSSIAAFTITNDRGVRYEFSDTVRYARTAHTSLNQDSVKYFRKDFRWYFAPGGAINIDRGIKYTAQWGLTRMTDPNGNFISLEYTSTPDLEYPDYYHWADYSVDSVNVYTGAPSNTFSKSYQYYMRTKMPKRWLIYANYGDSYHSKQAVGFFSSKPAPGFPDQLGPTVKAVYGYGKTYTFSYTATASRAFLTGLTSSVGDCVDPDSYSFEYAGLKKAETGGWHIALPDSASAEIDYWGYYNASRAKSLVPRVYINPSNPALERYRLLPPGNAGASYPYLLNGTDRSANPDSVVTGMLSKIVSANGGSTSLVYESNDFYDETADSVIKGGGVRIRKIVDNDGLDSTKNSTVNYSYTDPATGKSSGRPIAIPINTFARPYTGSGSSLDKWNFSTARLTDNLSSEENTIVYSYVRETQSGAGSTLYQFQQPATAWDSSAPPDWAPTVTYVGRMACAPDGYMTNGRNAYPFPPNTNFDFQRGLLIKTTSYADNGKEVSEASFLYSRTGSPTVITAFRYDTLGTTVGYAKYTIYANTDMQDTTITRKVYDSQSQTYSLQSVENMYYSSSHHKLVRQKKTNSNGTVINDYTSYVKDYSATPGSDSTTNALYRLRQLNVNAAVESYSTITRAGTTKTTAASLVKFRTFARSGYAYLPAQRLSFLSPDGTGSFSPSSISGGTFTYDSGYIPTENDQAYDYAAFPLTVDDNNRRVRTTIVDHLSRAPVAVVSNARYQEIGYNDFNSEIDSVSFLKSAYVLSANARSGQFGLELGVSETMSRTVSKSPQAGGYVFSIWIFSGSSGTITVSLTSGPNTNTDTISFSGNGKWSYYEKRLPIAGMGSSFAATFSSNKAVVIDDVLLYPDIAEVTTMAYDPSSHLVTAQTNQNGAAFYTTYDEFNRPRLTLDQDGNILSRKTYYVNSSAYPTLGHLNQIVQPYVNYVHTPYTYSVSGLPSCVADQVTASWNFGDGSPSIAGTYPSHTYAATGKYYIHVNLSSMFFPSQTILDSVTVVNNSANNVRISYGNFAGDPNRSYVTRLDLVDVSNPAHQYSFSTAELILGVNVTQATYSATVLVGTSHGTPVWNSLSMSTESTDLGCWSRSMGTTINGMLNLSGAGYLNIALKSTDCPLN